MTLLNLIRWKNLLFLAGTLLLMQKSVVEPILFTYSFEESLGAFEFILLLLATLLIAAGGYVINDYFDVKIDEINKPETRIVGRLIERRKAMVLHQILTVAGVICGLILAVLMRSFTLGMIYVFIPGLLWFYSASYKRQFFIGNLIVSFNIAFAIFLVAIINVAKLKLHYGDLLFQTPIAEHIYTWIGGFSVFAFLCTLVREIIKDIEDEAGDRELECHTLPIKLGVKKTKYFLYILIASICALLCYTNFHLLPFQGALSTRYLIFGLFIPFVALIFLLVIAKQKKDFRAASQLCKFIMAIGVLYSLIFYYLQAQAYGISIFGIFTVS